MNNYNNDNREDRWQIIMRIIIIGSIDGWMRVVVRQSIAGQCSNNSNGSHATLLKVVMIIIIIVIIMIKMKILIYRIIKD